MYSGQKDNRKLTRHNVHTQSLGSLFCMAKGTNSALWCQYVSVWQLRNLLPSLLGVSAQSETTGQYPQTNQHWTNNHQTTHTNMHTPNEHKQPHIPKREVAPWKMRSSEVSAFSAVFPFFLSSPHKRARRVQLGHCRVAGGASQI